MFVFSLWGRRIRLGHPLIVLFVILCFCGAYYAQIRHLSFDARMFPTFLIVGIAIAGCFIVKDNVQIESVGDAETPAADGASKETGNVSFLPSGTVLLFMLGGVVSIVLFVNTIAVLAILPAAALMLYLAGVRRLPILIGLPPALALFIYLFFEKWLSVMLPNMLQY
ncbi:MAG: tripartite tricarboxylate transporter TctB family protein [Methylobacteriaceae bacterium]|jgi:hypothetical protein|nr:tripartite tricarboxylate transporter TctB family protein [Methylobacteriaceae bacterium]